MWAIAAPALAASIAALAICSGVIGRSGCWSGRVMLPVTAQVMIVLSAMRSASRARAAISMAAPAAIATGSDEGAGGPHPRRRQCGMAPLQGDEAADHQARRDRERRGEAEPDAGSAPTETEAEAEREAHADRPVRDGGERHRPARVLEPAQGAGSDHLAAVEQLEQRGDREEG